jgi:hypothetical protein
LGRWRLRIGRWPPGSESRCGPCLIFQRGRVHSDHGGPDRGGTPVATAAPAAPRFARTTSYGPRVGTQHRRCVGAPGKVSGAPDCHCYGQALESGKECARCNKRRPRPRRARATVVSPQ